METTTERQISRFFRRGQTLDKHDVRPLEFFNAKIIVILRLIICLFYVRITMPFALLQVKKSQVSINAMITRIAMEKKMNTLAKSIYALQNNQDTIEGLLLNGIERETIHDLWNVLKNSSEEVAKFFEEVPVEVEWYGLSGEKLLES